MTATGGADRGVHGPTGAMAADRGSGRAATAAPGWMWRGALGLVIVLGTCAVAWLAFRALGRVRLAVVPLVLAVFPTIVLLPVVRSLKARGVPPAAAAAATVTGALAALATGSWLIGRAVVGQFDDVGVQFERGYAEIRAWLVQGPVGYDPGPAEQLWDQLTAWALDPAQPLVDPARLALGTMEGIVALVLGVVAVFFYLKDGNRLVAWIPDVLPERYAVHADAIGASVWDTVGGYFRGQVVVALVDAVCIGVALYVLDVPLALPLAALVFVGGFFPIVGATVTGLLASVVALTHGGLGLALAVAAVVLMVQQLEGNVLEPYIVGRATRTNPFLILVALSVGGVAYGLLGAFLAVPLTAASLRVVEYALRQRRLRDAAAPHAAEVADRSGDDAVGVPARPVRPAGAAASGPRTTVP